MCSGRVADARELGKQIAHFWRAASGCWDLRPRSIAWRLSGGAGASPMSQMRDMGHPDCACGRLWSAADGFGEAEGDQGLGGDDDVFVAGEGCAGGSGSGSDQATDEGS